QYAFTSQNYTLTQRSLDELQTVYFPSSLIQSSQAYNRFPISNRHLYLHFSLLYITYHMHTGNMKLAAERLSEVHHILDSNSLNDINVDGSTGETTIHISPVSESSLSLSYPNNNDKSSTTSQNLPLKICWLSNSQIYALTFLISGICNRGDTATMKSTMFLTEGLKIVEHVADIDHDIAESYYAEYCNTTRFTEKVLLKEIKALTLHRDQYTTGRRVSPIKQIECVNGDACHVYRPDVIQCINVDVNWRCEAELPNYIKFGSLSVICEGYDYPDDSYVLKGSCGLKYSFYYKDYSNYPDHKINSDDDKFIEEFFEYRN
ncbi:11826_t:CDS:2, partial [Entrophospora sp. SA101]